MPPKGASPIPVRQILFLLLLGALLWSWSESLWAAEPCEPPNLIPKSICNFDRFSGQPPRQIPDGWTPFILAGDLSFSQDADTMWEPPALRMWTNGGTFKAGIYTQVDVAPGGGYRASISWGAPNSPETFGRQLGIDPTGGTDPNAPTVVWGPTHWGPGRVLNYTDGKGPNVDVVARAQSGRITIFFLVDHPRSTGDNLIFVDVIALYPDESAAPLPAPTDPPVVAAALPPMATPFPPTATLTPEPSATPTATETATSVPTATPTATPSPTTTPTATVTPTWTPLSTVTPQPTEQVAILIQTTEELTVLKEERPSLFWMIGLLGLSGAGLFGGSLWRLRRKNS